MGGGVLGSPPIKFTISSAVQSKPHYSPSRESSLCSLLTPPRMMVRQHRLVCQTDLRLNTKLSLRCNCCSSSPGGPNPGEDESKNILDAFFLGKALAEALNERIESTVGEFLSTIGRLQAEQQKQILDFQEDVLERAKQAKEKATRESMEARGFVNESSSSPTSTSAITIVENGVDPTDPPPNASSFSGEIVISDED